MIKRIFHPIGQGAFYSERHDGFNFVYDCGALPKSKASGRLVEQSFNKSDEIDILFISHFDSDHVNQIETLKGHCSKIKVVVLPLLDPDEKELVANFYRVIDNPIVQLISSPEDFFDDDTTIIYVKPSEDQETTTEGEFSIEVLTNGQEIESGATIIKSNDWCFIPFNYKFRERHKNFIKLLAEKRIGKNRLSSDLDYTLSKKSDLRSIYRKLGGNINQNSMFVYSGPKATNTGLKSSHLYREMNCPSKYCKNLTRQPGCIYTGDGDLNVVGIKNVYSNQWSNVGTIQIPHHGSLSSFKLETFSNGGFVCPISYGTKNSYGHPSSMLIVDLESTNNMVCHVTEFISSLYCEVLK